MLRRRCRGQSSATMMAELSNMVNPATRQLAADLKPYNIQGRHFILSDVAVDGRFVPRHLAFAPMMPALSVLVFVVGVSMDIAQAPRNFRGPPNYAPVLFLVKREACGIPATRGASWPPDWARFRWPPVLSIFASWLCAPRIK